jgi:hypothetical protein
MTCAESDDVFARDSVGGSATCTLYEENKDVSTLSDQFARRSDVCCSW